MIPMPTTGSAELMRAAAAFNTKVAAGISKLAAITDEQVQIATTPKDEVFKSDKVTLYRYRPLAKRKVATPVLIVYSLIGRYTMTDLQEDRSLIRNLLKQGLDVWVIDWGSASRADRYLTIDDYVLGYLDDCVAAMRRETEAEAVNLLRITIAHRTRHEIAPLRDRRSGSRPEELNLSILSPLYPPEPT